MKMNAHTHTECYLVETQQQFPQAAHGVMGMLLYGEFKPATVQIGNIP
jgi:hypothetical protein